MNVTVIEHHQARGDHRMHIRDKKMSRWAISGAFPVAALVLLVMAFGSSACSSSMGISSKAQADTVQAQVNAYVANENSTTVSVIDTATNTITATIPVGSNPASVALTPDRPFLYVANAGSNSVSVVDTATNTVTATVPVGSLPLSVAIK